MVLVRPQTRESCPSCLLVRLIATCMYFEALPHALIPKRGSIVPFKVSMACCLAARKQVRGHVQAGSGRGGMVSGIREWGCVVGARGEGQESTLEVGTQDGDLALLFHMVVCKAQCEYTLRSSWTQTQQPGVVVVRTVHTLGDSKLL